MTPGIDHARRRDQLLADADLAATRSTFALVWAVSALAHAIADLAAAVRTHAQPGPRS